MRRLALSRREITVWGSVIGALAFLGLIVLVAGRVATRVEVQAPVDPYRAVIADVDPVKAHLARACSYEAEGSTEMAIREYVELVRINPDDITAHGCLSALYFKMNDRDRAVAEILEVLRIDPSKWAQREILADTYCEMGNDERACAEYEEVLRYAPEYVEVRCRLGRVYQRAGRPTFARDMFRKAVETDPKSAEAHLGLESALRAMGDLEGAAREAELARGLTRDDEAPMKPGIIPPYRPLRARGSPRTPTPGPAAR